MHAVVDEVYMLSVINPTAKPVSVLSLKSVPDPMRTHVIWGTSKVSFCVSYGQYRVPNNNSPLPRLN